MRLPKQPYISQRCHCGNLIELGSRLCFKCHCRARWRRRKSRNDPWN